MKKNLFLLLALGTYTAAQACPCGCVKVCVDTLADRPAAPAGAYTLDLRLDLIDQSERNSGAHAHWYGTHDILTATVETTFAGQTWSLSVPRIERRLNTDKVPTLAVPNPTQYHQQVVGLGDIVVATRLNWSGFTVNAGVKLPTGKDNVVFADPAGDSRANTYNQARVRPIFSLVSVRISVLRRTSLRSSSRYRRR